LDVDRRILIGRALRPATYTVTEVDVNDFLGVVDEPGFAATRNDSGSSEVTTSAKGVARLAPPSFAPFVAVLGLLKTFDWQDDFLFDYRTGTAMFGEQSIEFHRPLRVGESVAISAAISDVYEKQGKRRFDVIEVSFQISGSEEGDRLMSGQQSYILFK
jgi:hydroxyacyl-ACP dehydratase HTD2-like protein with hotdog domain